MNEIQSSLPVNLMSALPSLGKLMNEIISSLPLIGFWETRQGGRKENQDSCDSIETPYGQLIIVCDGMGGGPAGRLASTTAIKRIEDYLLSYIPQQQEKRSEILCKAINAAHQRILDLADEDPSRKGMGTTVAAVLVDRQDAILAHVGDTRIYQFRGKEKIFRTQDHSMVGELVRNGTLTEEQARLSSQSNLITRALGSQDSRIDIDVRPFKCHDRFMLCSDGVWGMFPEKELISRTAQKAPLEDIVSHVAEDTDQQGRQKSGKHDNLTIAMFETLFDSQSGEHGASKRYWVVLLLTCLIAIVVLGVWYFMRIKGWI